MWKITEILSLGLTQLQQGGVNGEQRFSPNHEPVSQTTTKKGCKRRGGWKFHDFSDESETPGKKKRMYCHNRLENDILQVKFGALNKFVRKARNKRQTKIVVHKLTHYK